MTGITVEEQTALHRIGSAVYTKRTLLKLTVAELGALAETSGANVSRLENGTNAVRLTTLMRILKALDVEPKTLAEVLEGLLIPFNSERAKAIMAAPKRKGGGRPLGRPNKVVAAPGAGPAAGAAAGSGRNSSGVRAAGIRQEGA